MYPGYDPDTPIGGGDANLKELQRLSHRAANPSANSYKNPGLFAQYFDKGFNTTPRSQLAKIGGKLPLSGRQYPGHIPSTARISVR